MLVGILVPITFFLVTGLVWVSYIFFRSKEKQMMIEKGMSYEQMVEFIKQRKNPYTMLKLGIISIFFGVGLGVGIFLEDAHYSEGWIPLLLFVSVGLGMVVAFVVTKKYEMEDDKVK